MTRPRHTRGVGMPRLIVLVNASSGSGEKAEAFRRLSEALAARGIEADVLLVQEGAELGRLARRAAQEGAAIVAAAGGDGTINAVASALVGTKTSLAVLPLGTLNHFAKDLGIPLDLADAARTLAEGRVVEVDVGEVNGRVFVNNSSLGVYARLVREREKRRRRGWSKWPAMVLAALAVLPRLPTLRVRVSAGGRMIVRRTPLVFVGNNVYEMEGLELGARGCLDAGQLSLCITRYGGLRGLLRLVMSALVGRLAEARDFEMLCVKEVWIEARRGALPVALDGEVTLLEMPLHYRIRPGALRVVVPAEGATVSG